MADARSEIKSEGFYHSEVVICPRDLMYKDDQQYLEKQVKKIGLLKSYVEIPKNKWKSMTFRCKTLSYAYNEDADSCGGVSKFNQDFNVAQAGIGNADLTQVWKYVYG